MVSYYNPLSMYRQQQNAQYSPTPAWYPQSSQQYHPACMGDEGHPVPGPWGHIDSHHKYIHHPFPADWTQDCNHFQQPSPPISEVSSPGAEGMTPPHPPGGGLPGHRPSQPKSPYEWMKKPSYQSQPNPGKTRTKDKYRVVYTDHQRLELEKEFHYSRYITIRRKAELATNLGLSERQVKIWFQNRRAKERKQVKKREETQHKIKQEVIDPLSSAAVASSMSLHHMAAGSVPLHGAMTLM